MMTLFFKPDNGPIRMNLLIGLREKLVEGFRFFRRCGVFDAQDHHVIPIDIATDGGGFAHARIVFGAHGGCVHAGKRFYDAVLLAVERKIDSLGIGFELAGCRICGVSLVVLDNVGDVRAKLDQLVDGIF